MKAQRMKAKRYFQHIDALYTPSGKWWAEQLGVSPRTIPRLRNSGEVPNPTVTARILAVASDVRSGTTIPPCRVQAILPTGTSRFRGVHWHTAASLWRCVIKGRYAQYFPSEEQAALAYNRKALEVWGRCAYINQVPEVIELTCECCQFQSPFVFRMEWSAMRLFSKKGTRCRGCAHGLRWNYDREFYAHGRHLKQPRRKNGNTG